jgi:predicted lysophospholipase L1 biosynthesis ABC-type transport system permease subunit
MTQVQHRQWIVSGHGGTPSSWRSSQQVPEIGVRMALGATAGHVRRQVLREMLWMAMIGIALGAAVSLVLARVIDSLLFATSATDPLTSALTVGCWGVSHSSRATCPPGARPESIR